MSNIKYLIGDMDFEEFEVKRKMVINKVKDMKTNDFIELYCDDTTLLYDCWLDIGGRYIASKHMLNQYGGRIVIDQVDEFVEYLIKRFVDWLEGFG